MKQLNAEIISVGTELLLGNITNTDARDISEMLSTLGINVYYHTVVGDNPERLAGVVEIAKSRSDIIITTGGLGPTCDDLTKQALAACFGLELYFDEEEEARIRGFFKNLRGSEMTENNLQQAMLPRGCTVFRNEWGTAPGCAFFAEDTHVLMLPGPPRECRAMFVNRAMPYLRELSEYRIVSHNIRVFGEGESTVEDKLRDLMNELTNPTLAPYAKEGEVMLRLTAKAKEQGEAEAMMAPVLQKVLDTLGDLVYAVDADSFEETVLHLLEERGLTVAAAESCTGGLFAKRLTDIPGASKTFKGSAVTYSIESKTALLGVPEELLADKGAVSAEVAAEMAQGARKRFNADLGVGITGAAGPEPDGAAKAGTVFVALAAGDEVYTRELRLGSTGRDRIRTAAVNYGLDMIRRYLKGMPVIRAD